MRLIVHERERMNETFFPSLLSPSLSQQKCSQVLSLFNQLSVCVLFYHEPYTIYGPPPLTKSVVLAVILAQEIAHMNLYLSQLCLYNVCTATAAAVANVVAE